MPNTLNEILDYGDRIDRLTDQAIRALYVRDRMTRDMTDAKRAFDWAQNGQDWLWEAICDDRFGRRSRTFSDRAFDVLREADTVEDLYDLMFDALTSDDLDRSEKVKRLRRRYKAALKGTCGTLLGDHLKRVDEWYVPRTADD